MGKFSPRPEFFEEILIIKSEGLSRRFFFENPMENSVKELMEEFLKDYSDAFMNSKENTRRYSAGNIEVIS